MDLMFYAAALAAGTIIGLQFGKMKWVRDVFMAIKLFITPRHKWNNVMEEHLDADLQVEIQLHLSANRYTREDLKFLYEVGKLEWANVPEPLDTLGIEPGECDCAWQFSGEISFYVPDCEYHGHLAEYDHDFRLGQWRINRDEMYHLIESHREGMPVVLPLTDGCHCNKCKGSDNPACKFGCAPCHDEEYQRKLNDWGSSDGVLS